MALDLTLNSITSPIDENGTTTLTGTIAGVGKPGGEVTLNIDWGEVDLNGNPIVTDNQSLTVVDGGANDTDGLANGSISLSLNHQYLDDNPTATFSDTYKIDVTAKENLLTGTDAVFIIDRSGSTQLAAQGVTTVGDQNGDGRSNNILDVEIASFIALNQSLIDRGLGSTAKVSVVQFDDTAQLLDLDPVAVGVQTFTNPLADTDGNGILDVVQALKSLQFDGATNYEAALQQAIVAVNNAGTAPGQGSVIFLSDGQPNVPGTSASFYSDEANTLKTTEGQNLRAFGVGTGADLPPLQAIDIGAQVFTNPQTLLDVFNGTGASSSQDSAAINITVNDVAPVLDTLTNNLVAGKIFVGDALTIGSIFTDVGTQDTHTGSIDWGDTNTSNLGAVVGTAGGSHIYNTPGTYTATLKVTDDDTLFGNQSITFEVVNKTKDIVIDWKPGSNPSAMNLAGKGTVPVAILGTADFTVSQIAINSIRADDQKDSLLNGGGVGVNVKNNGQYQFSYEDVNKDGFQDLVLHFDTQLLGSVVKPNELPFATDQQIYLYGLAGGSAFLGTQQLGDPIKVV